MVTTITEMQVIKRDTGLKIEMMIQGHITDAVDRALAVGEAVLGEGRWRLISANYHWAGTNEFASSGSTFFDLLTPEDQLTRLESRPGSSQRETAKLLRRIEKRGKTNG